MARPRSEARRQALLDAAKQVFAAQGLGAPTALIARTAGVSEGSLFTYFKTKDELIVALYRGTRQGLAERVMAGFPKDAAPRDRLAHVWTRYVAWGAAEPITRKAHRLIGMSDAVPDAVRAEGDQLFADFHELEDHAAHLPPRMASAIFKAMAETTMDLIVADPAREAAYTDAGFAMLWAALTAGA